MTHVGVLVVVFDVALVVVSTAINVNCVVVVPFVVVVVGIPLLLACETMDVNVVIKVCVGVVVAHVFVVTNVFDMKFIAQGIIGIPTVV